MKALLMAPMGSVHRRFNRANITALIELGYEVHLLANFNEGEGTEKQNPEFVERCEKEGIAVHSIPYARHSLFKNLKLIKQTKQLLKQEKFDLVHAHTETGGLIMRLSCSAIKKAKKVYTPHGMSFYKGGPIKSQLIYRPIERWICRKMDENLAINGEEYRFLLKWKKRSANLTHGIGLNIQRIQNASKSAEETRADLGVPNSALIILSIGELDDNKNHKTVIDAIAKLDRNDIYYVVCGVGAKDVALKQQAENLGINDRVILAGYRRDIPEIINCADLFVFPSFHEGLPVSLMEAMAGGLAIICSSIRGNVDLITDGDNGFLFDPHCYLSLFDKLVKLIEDKKLREDFGKKVKEQIVFYSEEKVVEELKGIYGK